MSRTLRFGAASSVFLALLTLPWVAHAADSDLFTRSLNAYGWFAALPAAFLVGLATAATPCVYQMIAITVSVFGARNESRARAMALSTAFVAGIASMFVPLGLVAGLSGSVAGAMAGKLGVQLFEAALMFAMAASMFGLFEISLPGSVLNRLAAIGGLGLKGAYLIGLATGPIAAPCATAGLVGILDYVFRTRNAVGGGTALLVYSMGLGLPFWLVGTFSVGLPKPGRWMNHVKSVLGLVLVVVGFWYLRRAIPFLASPPRALPSPLWVAGAMAIVGLAIGAIHLQLKEGAWHERARKVIGIALASVGFVWLIGYEPPSTTHTASGACGEIAWERDPNAAQQLARREGRPMVIDFGATWCPACEELAHITFRSPQVACAASEGRFVSVKIYEDENPPANYDQLRSQYNVRALPTVVVLDAHGREVARETQFVNAERMAALLHRADDRRTER
jgi:thiol:disulfide interchange protein DsbD